MDAHSPNTASMRLSVLLAGCGTILVPVGIGMLLFGIEKTQHEVSTVNNALFATDYRRAVFACEDDE